MGISLFAGEAEGRLGEVLRDADAGTLKPLYNFMNDLPNIEGAPMPAAAGASGCKRTAGAVTSFDAGRGCPYQCSFCTIINVQGRKSRRRSPDDIEQIVRVNVAQGLHRFFITDDNFARNKDWEADPRPADPAARGGEAQVQLHHPGRHALPQAPELHREVRARRRAARLHRAREHQSRTACVGAKKRQNKITEYRKMLLAWKKAGIITYAATSSASPTTRRNRSLHDIEIIKKELPVDLLEFFYLTPLPGSEDHQKLFTRRRRRWTPT